MAWSQPPTQAGFISFIRNGMGVPQSALPDNSIYIVWAYNAALDTVDPKIAAIPGYFYTAAVYNLGGDFLINWAQDVPNVTTPPGYWENLRTKFKIVPFTAGVIASTSDESTSENLEVINAAKDFLLSDLQNLKTPYGRAYVAIAMRQGSLWGIS